MLIDQIAASLPTENVIADTYSRKRELRKVFYGKPKKPAPEPVAIEEKPKTVIKPIGPQKPRDRDYLILGTRRFLPDWQQVRNYTPPLQRIKREVSEKTGIPINEMNSERRFKKIVWARFEFYYRAKRETDASLPEIGRAIGGKDHTTVMHGIRKYEEFLAQEGGKE